MRITLNNREEQLDTKAYSLSIRKLLQLKNFTFTRLVVKVNGQLVKRADYDTATFSEGDTVEVIHLISGG